jgi:hypothetical protein
MRLFDVLRPHRVRGSSGITDGRVESVGLVPAFFMARTPTRGETVRSRAPAGVRGIAML